MSGDDRWLVILIRTSSTSVGNGYWCSEGVELLVGIRRTFCNLINALDLCEYTTQSAEYPHLLPKSFIADAEELLTEMGFSFFFMTISEELGVLDRL